MVNKLKRANHNRDQTNHYSDWLSDAREQSKLIGQDMCIIPIHSRIRKSQRHTYRDLKSVTRLKKIQNCGQEKRVGKSSRRILYFFETRMTLYKLRIEYFNSLMLLVT